MSSTAHEEQIHVFDNGVKVYEVQITRRQRERYTQRNVHEADEEGLFVTLINSVPTRGCYVNIGSAIGYYALLAKTLSPTLTIHAVEPLSMHREYFLRNIVLNGFEASAFVLHSEGISSTCGSATLLERSFGSRILKTSESMKSADILKSVSCRTTTTSPDPSNETRIRTITLDQLISRIGVQVDLLQMDVQGLETVVLDSGRHSLRSGKVSTLLVGTHGDDVHRECVRILEEHAYTIEFEEADTRNQPDGIVVASRNRRLQSPS